MRICINAGHFPTMDSGAVGASGLQEADVTKVIAEKVVSILKEAGHNALFVQRNELWDIVQTSNDFNAGLFVSIHCNAAENQNARGTETFAHPESEKGKLFAECIQKQIIANVGTVDRGVKTSNFQVLRQTHCPAVLVECAFISNEQDECMLADLNTQERFARAIVEGINNYVAG